MATKSVVCPVAPDGPGGIAVCSEPPAGHSVSAFSVHRRADVKVHQRKQ